MPLPGNLTAVTLTGTYVTAVGTPCSGSVTFYLDAVIADATGSVILYPSATAATLDVNGHFSIELPATDDTHLYPEPFTYRVLEKLTGAQPRVYSISLPSDLAPTVDLSTLTPSQSINPVGVAITGTPTAGQVPTATGPSTADWQTPTGGAGDLLAANNLSDVESPSTARTNLGLGNSAVLNVGTTSSTVAAGNDARITGAAQKSANLSDLASASAARTSLGLGGAAVLNVGTTSGTVAAGNDARFPTVQPWVFDAVQHGGAVGDGQWVNDAAITVGTNVLTSASGKFTPGDATKACILHYSSASGDAQVGTIETYVSANEVLLSINAGTTVTGGTFLWGTDDTMAWRTCVNDGTAYAQAHGGTYRVYTPPPPVGAFYMAAGPLVTDLDGNAQIPLPPIADTGQTITLDWVQEGASSAPQSWNSLSPAFNGATIVSAGIFANATDQGNSVGDFGNPCVIGGPAQASGYGQSGKFSNMIVKFSGTILTTHSRFGLSYCGLDFTSVKAELPDAYVGSTGCVARNDYEAFAGFSTGYSIGILMPADGNNDLSVIGSVTIGGGYAFGIVLPEHCTIHRLCVLYCSGALCPDGNYDGSVGSVHSSAATLISVESCTWIVQIFGKGSDGVGPTFHYRIDTETSLPRFGDRNGGLDMGAAKGEIELGGSFTRSGLILDGPPGFDLIDVNDTGTPVAGNYTISYFDTLLMVNAAAGNLTITLPTAVSFPVRKRFELRRDDSSGNTVTLAAPGGETVNGVASVPIIATPYSRVTAAAYNGEWTVG
jgi:hypothetical protein